MEPCPPLLVLHALAAGTARHSLIVCASKANSMAPVETASGASGPLVVSSEAKLDLRQNHSEQLHRWIENPAEPDCPN